MTYQDPIEHRILLDHKLPMLMYFYHDENGNPATARLDGETINGFSRRDAKVLQGILEQAVENLERFQAPRLTGGSKLGSNTGVGSITVTPLAAGGTISGPSKIMTGAITVSSPAGGALSKAAVDAINKGMINTASVMGGR